MALPIRLSGGTSNTAHIKPAFKFSKNGTPPHLYEADVWVIHVPFSQAFVQWHRGTNLVEHLLAKSVFYQPCRLLIPPHMNHTADTRIGAGWSCEQKTGRE